MYKCNRCNRTFKDKNDEGLLAFRGKLYCKKCEDPVEEIPDTPKANSFGQGAQATLISNSDNRITTNNYYGGGSPDEQIETPFGVCKKSEAQFCKNCRLWVPMIFFNTDQGLCDICIEEEGIKAYDEGKSFYEMGLYDEALEEFLKYEPVCKKPKVLVKLQYQIGRCYYEQKVWKKAFKYFIKTRDHIPESLFYIGLCFYYGYGISADKAKAYEMLKKAYLQGCQNSYAFIDSMSLFPIKKLGKAGYMDEEGHIIIPCKWEFTWRFSDGLAAVKEVNGKWGYIDKTGSIIIPYTWDSVDMFSEGLAMVMVQDEKEKYGYIDRTGRNVIPCIWEKAHAFHEGLAQVEEKNKYGFIDKTGNLVIPCKWKTHYEFTKGWSAAIYSRFSEGRAKVIDENERFGYIDKTGEVVIPYKWKEAEDFSEGLAAVKDENEKWGYINKSGDIVIPCKWKYARQFSEGYAAICEGYKKWGYIDKRGNILIPCKWGAIVDGANTFSEGLAAVKDEKDNWGFVDKTGRIVLPCIWKGASWEIGFFQGLSKVKDGNGKGYYIDKRGNIIAETEL